MAVTTRAALASGNGNTASLALTIPNGTVAGDLLVAVVVFSKPSTEAIATAPAGWTASSATGTTGGLIVGGAVATAVYYRIATASGAGSAGTTATWTFSGGANAGVTKAEGGVLALAGAGATVGAAIVAEAAAAETSAGTLHTSPLVTTPVAAHLLTIAADRGATTTTVWTPDASMTLDLAGYYPPGAAAPTFAVASKDVGAGQRGANQMTADQSTINATTWTIAVAPASSAPASQTVYPIADVTTDASITQTGGTAGQLFTAIDETVFDGTDFLEFTLPDGTKRYAAQLGPLTLPLSSLTIEATVQTPQAVTSSRVVEVLQGAGTTPIASRTFSGVSLPPNWITDSFALTASERAAITDGTNVIVRVTPTAS